MPGTSHNRLEFQESYQEYTQNTTRKDWLQDKLCQNHLISCLIPGESIFIALTLTCRFSCGSIFQEKTMNGRREYWPTWVPSRRRKWTSWQQLPTDTGRCFCSTIQWVRQCTRSS